MAFPLRESGTGSPSGARGSGSFGLLIGSLLSPLHLAVPQEIMAANILD